MHATLFKNIYLSSPDWELTEVRTKSSSSLDPSEFRTFHRGQAQYICIKSMHKLTSSGQHPLLRPGWAGKGIYTSQRLGAEAKL